jgi:hypothetical protein
LEEDIMKLALIGVTVICVVSASLPASAMPIAPLATSSAPADVILVHGHGHHYGWHHGHGHHYGWHHGWHH